MNDPYDGSSSLSAAEQRLAAELTALADSPAPGMGSDTAWAVRTGRSRLLRRRLAALGAVTAVSVGAATLGVVWPEGGAGSTVAAAASGSGSGSVGPRVGPDTGHDPLVVQATFGWLPAGFDDIEYDKGFSGQPEASQAKAIGPKQTNTTTDRNRQLLFLTVHAPGVEPPLDLGGGLRYRVDTTPINGRPAYWVGSAPGNPAGVGDDRTLRFKLADGRWAELHASYMSDADNVANVLVQAATEVRTEPRAVAMPFRIKSLPAGLTPASASLGYGPEAAGGYPWTASIGFTLNGKWISVTAHPDTTPAPPTNGRVTRENSLLASVDVPEACKSSKGVKLCVSAMDGEAPFASIGGFNGLLDRVTSRGTDENAWTTEVLH
ncbi:hypothetical protein GCM10009639_00050 [Kitasatospora putterlickiae]|uniref:Uncharacterized protein n=1 Tax=Kitasatospora putterlickiae TaxID=221725 RepID=A0ABN1XHN6_9ACTN